MKRFFLGIATLLALTFSMASSALTLGDFTGASGDNVYGDTGAQYVHVTDLTPPQTVPMIELSAAALGVGGYTQNFIIGIFDPTSGITMNVLDTGAATPVMSNQLTFDASGVVDDYGNSANIGTTFGFFIQFYSGGTYSSDGSPDLFSIFYDPAGITSLPGPSTEVVLGIGGTGTGPDGHALVMVRDVAPVPLPAAAWLFGSALVGLLGLGRRSRTTAVASA